MNTFDRLRSFYSWGTNKFVFLHSFDSLGTKKLVLFRSFDCCGTNTLVCLSYFDSLWTNKFGSLRSFDSLGMKKFFFFVPSIAEVWIYSFFFALIQQNSSLLFSSFFMSKAFVPLCSCKFFASQENRSSCCYWRDLNCICTIVCVYTTESFASPRPASSAGVLAGPGHVWTTVTCMCCSWSYLHTLQSPVLHLNVFPLQGLSCTWTCLG